MIPFHFYKMHGTGNDFILVDDRARAFPVDDPEWIRRLCNRHHGVGADGVVLIEPSAEHDFTMRFFNPDGHEADLCANGARCVARLARDLKLADPDMCFGTAAGPMRAEILPGGVRIHMPPPRDLRRGIRLPGYDGEIAFINTGVPHAVVFTTGLAGTDILPAARLLRHHPFFSPEGVNVNFVEPRPGHPGLFVRTFERGVEGETLACGTGITASALLAALQFDIESPVQALCRHGETLEVSFERHPDGTFSHVTLTGPAEYVFNGSARYP